MEISQISGVLSLILVIIYSFSFCIYDLILLLQLIACMMFLGNFTRQSMHLLEAIFIQNVVNAFLQSS